MTSATLIPGLAWPERCNTETAVKSPTGSPSEAVSESADSVWSGLGPR
jgi:hypothetical protein